jgi:hypothetical protein
MRKRLSAGALIESMAPILGKLQPLHAQYRGRIKLASHRITSDVFPNLMNQQISFPSMFSGRTSSLERRSMVRIK